MEYQLKKISLVFSQTVHKNQFQLDCTSKYKRPNNKDLLIQKIIQEIKFMNSHKESFL